MKRFSSSEGYALYPDVLPFFRSLRETTSELRRHRADTAIGVLTNSDGRVPQILSSFGLSVGPWRYGAPHTCAMNSSGEHRDIDFVALSYDIGFEKPDSRIFDAAKGMVHCSLGQEPRYIHVGDDLGKDYFAAQAAGWHGVLLDRHNEHSDKGLSRVRELSDLNRYLVS